MPKISPVDKLIQHLDKLFSVRARSEKEIRDYFKAKNYKLKIKNKEQITDSLIDLAIKRLKEQNLINDLQFARLWAESRSRKYGPQRIKQELFQKGIDRDLIDEVTLKQATGNSEQVAHQALEKKMKSWKNLPILKFKKKAYDFLLRRGFEYEIVKSVVEKYIRRGYN